MHKLIQELLERGPALTDGAWGTQLQVRGLSLGEFPDGWNISNPGQVEAVAKAYVAAGSHIILTNTFGSNPIRLREYGLEGKLRDLNLRGVEISRKAAGAAVRVFASIGPTGKLLMNGDVTEDEMSSAFEAQALALAEGGADALVVETMSDLEEARIAVAQALKTKLPVVACMVFDSGKDKDRTMMGSTPEQVAKALSEAGADVIGANCGQGIAGFPAICKRLRASTDRPIWIKSNAGLPEMVEGEARYNTSPDEFANYIPALLDAGASFIGGCCGTSPDFIATARKQI